MSLGFTTARQGSPNVCSDPYAPSFWLGKPGSLTQLRVPGAGYPRTLNDEVAVRDLLDGRSVDRSPYGSRTWQLDHEWLQPDAATVMYEYATRQRGFGPFVFIDPHAKNLLSPNQASGTDALHTTEGFAVTGTGEVLSSSTAWFQQGERSLAWQISPPVTGSGGILRVVAPTGLYGWCVPPGTSVAFSGYVRQGNAADISVDITPRIAFMNGAGQVQSYVSAPVITTVTGSAQAFCLLTTVPTGTGGVYLEPQFSVTGSSVAGTAIIMLDQLQLETGLTAGAALSACSVWEYGQGQPLVSVAVSNEVVPRVRRSTLTFTVIEVT